MRISKRRCKCTCVYTKNFFCFVSLFIKKLLMTPQGVDRADTVKAVYVLDKAHIAQSAHCAHGRCSVNAHHGRQRLQTDIFLNEHLAVIRNAVAL